MMTISEAGWAALAQDVFRLGAGEPHGFRVLAVRTTIQLLPVRDRTALELHYGLNDGVRRDYEEVDRLLPHSIAEDETVPKSADLTDAQQVIAVAVVRLKHDLCQMLP